MALALTCASVWATLLFLVPDDAGDVQQLGGTVIYYLSFPLGWLSAIFDGHAVRPSQLILYLLLMISNSFLLGYSIAGLFRLFRYACGPSLSKA